MDLSVVTCSYLHVSFVCLSISLQLLAKERELSEKLNTLKETNVQVVSLKSEVARLRRFEEEISNIQVSFVKQHFLYSINGFALVLVK